MPSWLVRSVARPVPIGSPLLWDRSRCHGPGHADFPRADAVRHCSRFRLVPTTSERSVVSPSTTFTLLSIRSQFVRVLFPIRIAVPSLSPRKRSRTIRLVPSRRSREPAHTRSFFIARSFVRPSPRCHGYPLFGNVGAPHPFRGWISPLAPPLDRFAVRSPPRREPSERPTDRASDRASAPPAHNPSAKRAIRNN